MLFDFLNYGVVRGAIASKNRLARQCEAGEVPTASELGDAAYLWPKAYKIFDYIKELNYTERKKW